MTRFKLGLLATAAMLTVGAANAQLKGTADVSASYATVTAPYDNAKSVNTNFLFDLEDGFRAGFSVTALDAWGDKANIYSLRAVTPFNKNVWLDSGIAFSDKARISIRRAAHTTLNVKIPEQSLILNVGMGYNEMRGGGRGNTVSLGAVYYVPNMPLVLQGTATYSESRFNSRGGMRYSWAATYGHAKRWTITGRYSTGRAHYELINFPGSIADYQSHTVGITGRYWLTKDWGVSLGASNVKNRYYERNEIKVGAFMSF